MKSYITFHDRMLKALTTDIPVRITNDAERFFKDSFKRQGWLGAHGFRPWRPVKNPNGKGRKGGRRILKGTGNLMQSIRTVQADWNRIELTAGNAHVPYAKIHNEGGWIRGQVTRRAHIQGEHVRRTKRGKRVTVREHTVRRHQAKLNMHMPRRQFMGSDSPALEQIMRNTIIESLRRARHNR